MHHFPEKNKMIYKLLASLGSPYLPINQHYVFFINFRA